MIVLTTPEFIIALIPIVTTSAVTIIHALQKRDKT